MTAGSFPIASDASTTHPLERILTKSSHVKKHWAHDN
jgi:hypothetical protein